MGTCDMGSCDMGSCWSTVANGWVVPVDGILVVVDVGDELTLGNPPARTESGLSTVGPQHNETPPVARRKITDLAY